jgi:hypothetical protein
MNDLQLVLSSPNEARFRPGTLEQIHKETTMGEALSQMKIVYLYRYIIELCVEASARSSSVAMENDSLRHFLSASSPTSWSMWPGTRCSARKVDDILIST